MPFSCMFSSTLCECLENSREFAAVESLQRRGPVSIVFLTSIPSRSTKHIKARRGGGAIPPTPASVDTRELPPNSILARTHPLQQPSAHVPTRAYFRPSHAGQPWAPCETLGCWGRAVTCSAHRRCEAHRTHPINLHWRSTLGIASAVPNKACEACEARRGSHRNDCGRPVEHFAVE